MRRDRGVCMCVCVCMGGGEYFGDRDDSVVKSMSVAPTTHTHIRLLTMAA